MRLKKEIIVPLPNGQLLQSVRQSATVEDLAGTVGRLPKTIDRHEQLLWIAQLLGEVAGASIGFGRAGRAIPFGCKQ